MKGELHLPDLPEVPVALSPLSSPVDDQQRRTRPHWTIRLRESMLSYLPLLLMVMLALGTWLIAKNTPGLLAPSAPAAPKHEADYTLDRFTLQRFDATGALKVEIEGDHMQHFPDDDIMEVEKIRVTTTDPDGRRMIATAQHGRARGDSTEVWLDGQAQVVSESGVEGDLPIQMNGEHLHALPKQRRVDSTFMVIVHQGDSEFNADGLEYEDNTRMLTLHGNVHALMQPSLRKAVAVDATRKSAKQ
jgi:lipopolysaccharide export system protein LptC